jgi:GT2 family glycosyltransferase
VTTVFARAHKVWRNHGLAGVIHRARGRLALALGWRREEGSFPYAAWIAENEPDGAALRLQRAAAVSWSAHPVLSVVPCPMPTGRHEAAALIETLQGQTYPFWELCLLPEAQAAAEDHRIVQGPPHGEWLVLLSRGALLAPEALFEAANRLAAGDADVLYADNDLLDRGGHRHRPFLKPDFSPELLLSVDYLAPFLVLRRALLRPSAPPCNQAEHWELALRLAEGSLRIAHVPRVLAHARVPSDLASGRAAVEAHLSRRGLAARVDVTPKGRLRAAWPTPSEKVGVVIPTRDGVARLAPCLASVARTRGRISVVVVDNGSQDPATLDFLAREAAAGRIGVLRRPGSFNWSALNNAGARAVESELLAFLNDDIEALDEDWLEELVRWAWRPEVGVAGGLLVRPGRTVQHAGVAFGLGGVAAHPFEHLSEDAQGPLGSVGWYRDWLAVTGACQVTRREVFESLGGFDESFGALFSDIDFCLRAHSRGLRIVFTPFARLLHHHGTTRGGDDRMPPHDFLVARERFADILEGGDPYFNPNLSRWSAVPTLRQAREPNPNAWLATLTGLLAERFPGDAARVPQPISSLADEVEERLRVKGVEENQT